MVWWVDIIDTIIYQNRVKRDMGGKAKAHRSNPSSARSRVRRNGRRSQGGWRHGRRFLPEEDATSRESERGSSDVGVPDLLHKGRIYQDRQRRGQHSPRYTVVRSAHSKRTLRIRKPRGTNNPNTKEGRPDLRQRSRYNRTFTSQDWLPGHPRKEPCLQVQPSRSRLVIVFTNIFFISTVLLNLQFWI